MSRGEASRQSLKWDRVMVAKRLQNSSDWFLALGVLLALLTQLRSNASILGPGEIFLACWLCVQAFQALAGMPAAQGLAPVAIFWGLFAFALCLGLIHSIVSGVPLDSSLVIHDVFADLLLVALCVLLAPVVADQRRLSRLYLRIMTAGVAMLALQLANAAGVFALGGVDPWYWERLRGWTANPNQFALLCLLIGFLALHVAERGSRAGAFAGWACGLLTLASGLLGMSNAYVLVVMLGLGVLFAAKVLRWMAREERRGFPAAWLGVSLAAALLYTGLLLAPHVMSESDLIRSAGGMARDTSKELEDSTVRLMLWRQALKRGMESGMIGYGPGPHLEIPAVVLQGRRAGDLPKNMITPELGLAANFEAHNTVLELFVQGGLLAAGGFLCIVGLAIVRAFRAGFDALAAGLIAINAFGSFHVIFRHPFFWLLMVGALSARSACATSRAKPRPFDDFALLKPMRINQ
ncbi:O-antigen ligase [Rhodoblastus acidophilus]|uniref:O-antigen ligase family protein n=1 Tax=Rhodoblastus acidophilus TaxID=1074 RepID=UPI0022258206|nr:O-antigen ligase family protein [Rhodoblastus acidophilus]MCW2285387.1 O-antigen ligase [Rhodoblastus acidophilus]MCW2334365.1 O-antigen ligase [Rhodoblastus acidophilus]